MLYYRAFGLRLAANVMLPGLLREKADSPADIAIHAGSLEGQDGLQRVEVEAGTFADRRVFRLENGNILIDFSDGTRFCIETSGSRIWTTWGSPFTVEDMATFLMGPILGYVVRLRGLVALHASSFVTTQGAVALLGRLERANRQLRRRWRNGELACWLTTSPS